MVFKQPPDYENSADANHDNIYIVTVVATDGVFETPQLLFVTVIDVVENVAPQITSYGGAPSATVQVQENQQIPLTVTAQTRMVTRLLIL
ncbi:MAG: hypothetical protein R3E93_03235 [Thiothrix sp.]